MKPDINENLQSLTVIRRYFPYLVEGNKSFPRNSLSPMVNIATVPEDVQGKLLDLRNDATCRGIFMEKMNFSILVHHHASIIPEDVGSSRFAPFASTLQNWFFCSGSS